MNSLFSKLAGKLFLLVAACLLLPLSAECQVRISSHHMAGAVSAPPVELDGYLLFGPTWTNFHSGNNFSITPGLSFQLPIHNKLDISMDFRGTLPMSQGNVAGLSNLVMGPGVSYRINNFRPYASFLIGPGHMSLVNPDSSYKTDNSVVYQYGGGVEYMIPGHSQWAAKVEISAQNWNLSNSQQIYGTSGVAEGKFTPVTMDFGMRYRFFGKRRTVATPQE
jgi:opacity protein-like surface antigen